jgi:hypothetical protein
VPVSMSADSIGMGLLMAGLVRFGVPPTLRTVFVTAFAPALSFATKSAFLTARLGLLVDEAVMSMSDGPGPTSVFSSISILMDGVTFVSSSSRPYHLLSSMLYPRVLAGPVSAESGTLPNHLMRAMMMPMMMMVQMTADIIPMVRKSLCRRSEVDVDCSGWEGPDPGCASGMSISRVA